MRGQNKKEKVFVGLDLGTSSFRALGVSLDADFQPKILGAVEAPASGLRKGIVVDMDDCSVSATNTLSDLQRIIKRSFKKIYTNINGESVSFQTSRGAIAVARADGEITRDDVFKVLKNSEKINLPSNRSIVHSIDLEYLVDGIDNINDPVGMNGIRLEVESLIIDCFTPWLRNIHKCVESLGNYKIEEVVYSPLLSSLATLSKNQKEIGTLVLDLGASTTGLIIFKEGKIITTKTLPLGGNNVTNDIAIALKIPVEIAEKLKTHFGLATPRGVSKKENINLNEVDQSLDGEVSRKYLAQIIEARMEEIFSLVSQELKKVNELGNLPGGVVLVGGGAKLSFVSDLAREKLKLSSQIGFSSNFSSESLWSEEEKKILEDPSWVGAVGLILWALDEQFGERKVIEKEESSFLVGKVRSFFRNFLP